MIAAGIHPHFQGTGFEALPLHFSKPFPWSSESVWLGLGSVKSGLPPPPPLPSPTLPPPLHFSSPLYGVICSEQSHLLALPNGALSPIKAIEPFPGPATGVCHNFNHRWRQLFPSWTWEGECHLRRPSTGWCPSWCLGIKVMFC